jgi:hypothetical protein
MALDLYDLNDVRLTELICSLNDAELNTLEVCLAELKQKTGITLDPYSTTRLYQNQIDIISRCLFSRQLQDVTKYKREDLAAIIREKLSIFKDGLIAIGD